jgi:hypothetical protein
MSDLHRKHLNLDRIDRNLAEGERRIAVLITQIKDLIIKDQDTTEAERLLRVFEETLETWHVRRQLIASSMARE